LHSKALSTLSQKSATVALLCDSLTFLRRCGQGLMQQYGVAEL